MLTFIFKFLNRFSSFDAAIITNNLLEKMFFVSPKQLVRKDPDIYNTLAAILVSNFDSMTSRRKFFAFEVFGQT
jgi:hypothetical protein